MVAKLLSIFAVTAWFISGTLASVELLPLFFAGISADIGSLVAVAAIAGLCGLLVDGLRYVADLADGSRARDLPDLKSVISRHF